MKVKSLLPYFGAKRRMASAIVEELGPHACYWEPFCGSMAVLFGKEPCAMETVNDLYGDLVNLALCVQDEAAAVRLFGSLSRTMLHQELYLRCRAVVRETEIGDMPNEDRAYAFFVASWAGMNGVCGTSKYNMNFVARYTRNGGHAATRFQSAIGSIPEWWERLRRVTVMNVDAFHILERIADDDRTVIYVDPPYIEKGARYIHDFVAGDHGRLAESLSRFKKARVVVSYYEHSRLEELYPGWTKRHVAMSKAMVNQGRRGGKVDVKADEVLLINGGSLVDDGMFTETVA